jgi:hypothetical protein
MNGAPLAPKGRQALRLDLLDQGMAHVSPSTWWIHGGRPSRRQAIFLRELLSEGVLAKTGQL